MTSFLEIVAQDLIRRFGSNLSDVAVVFPNKRASLFLDEALARNAGGRPVWAPRYITISELFRSHSSLVTGDSIELTCILHSCYTRITGSDESLDKFFGWGQLMIADFDDIDKNMADAEKVFRNLTDYHEFDNIDYLTDEQTEILKHFFSNFDDNSKTRLKEKFIRLWTRMENIYRQYKATLREQGIAYEGMLYRDVAENKENEYQYKHYAFVGFNVLQQVEQRVFRQLKDEGRALFYWDFDRYYMKENSEAGHYIRQYLNIFPSAIDISDDSVFSNFKRDKEIRYISAPTENIQARYISTWLRQGDRIPDGKKTAIVMCDESLLQTVIYCLPDEVGKVNITTGYPLSQTPVASFIAVLLNMQITGWSQRKGGFLRHHVKLVTHHPYFSCFSDDDKKDIIFRHVDAPTRKERVAALNAWIREIIRNIKDSDQLNAEALFRTYTITNRLEALIAKGIMDIEASTYNRLFSQLVRLTSVPFHGEPAEGVQVMGVLETRNLDFDHLLIISCNEGNMPKGVDDTSFIPYSIRKAYGLTTIDNKVAIYSYYFHRMLQRAKDITILYNNSTEGIRTGEMSRFMLQLLVESNHDIKRKTLIAGQTPQMFVRREMEKTEEVARRFREFLEKNISPTAINTYIRCNLRFYYKYMCGIKEPDNSDEDEIDRIKFGNIFHEAAEKLYGDLAESSRIITVSRLENILKDPSVIERYVDNAIAGIMNIDQTREKLTEALNGLQLINREVIISYMQKLLKRDIANCPFTIVGLEYIVKKPYKINFGGEEIETSIAGIIDRLDMVDSEKRIRVVDYKTGRSKVSLKSVEEIFMPEKQRLNHADYYLQTFLYSEVVRNDKNLNPEGKAVSPVLYFIQKPDNDPVLPLGKDAVTDIKQCEEEFNERLDAVIKEMSDLNTPFKPTSDRDTCANCPWLQICGRYEL